MRTAISRTLLAMIGALMAFSGAQAQEISGLSTMAAVNVCSGLGCTINGRAKTYILQEVAYVDTEEDYTASLYYDVSSDSAMFFSGNPTALTSGYGTGNPSASGSYSSPGAGLPGTVQTFITVPGLPPTYARTTYINGVTPGIYTETTNHIVDFFYITSVGEYYDPYGYSDVVDGQGGDYNSGYWWSVTVWGTYIAEASVILGQSYDVSNNTANSTLQGPSITTAMYQNFIPPDWVPGPGSPSCFSDIYAGDNRTFNPYLASFRAMQAISMGIGGLMSVNQSNAPPAVATGYSYEFSQSVLVNNVIPNTAWNYNYRHQCSPLGANDWGHATTASMRPPTVVYNGSNSTSTEFCCSAEDPVPILAFAVDWDVPLTLTEPVASDLRVTGTLKADCYPAHEVSVGGTDVATFMPTSNDLTHIAACLGGVGQVNQQILHDIPLTSY